MPRGEDVGRQPLDRTESGDPAAIVEDIVDRDTQPIELPATAVAELQLLVVGGDFTSVYPLAGDVLVGRSERADIRIDDPGVSRQHCVLRLRPHVTVEDLGSANGTRVAGAALRPRTRVQVPLGRVIEVGPVSLIIQEQATSLPVTQIWVHGYFEARVEGEVARARRAGGSLAVARLRLPPGHDRLRAEQTLLCGVRTSDVVGYYAPGDYEILLVDTGAEGAAEVVDRLRSELEAARVAPSVGVAVFPRDASSAGELLERSALAFQAAESERATPLLGQSPAVRSLYETVDRTAVGDISMLILGETGVGKEILAEHIHARSPRADAPLVKLNCASLSESLLESELFGHERGAFTGADQAKPGLIETADGGTLFLDEVGELPASMQAKLLRVIEDGEMLPVGGVKPHQVDVRIISATNRDLETEIAAGRFRADLYYRLSGVVFELPPLRERPDEIAPLARLFAGRAARRLGQGPEVTLEPEAIALLEAYRWPGNIRELRNFVERAVLVSGNPRIGPEHLPRARMAASAEPGPAPRAAAAFDQPTDPAWAGPPRASCDALSLGDSLQEQLRAVEHQHIVRALQECGGNQSRAAALLGVSRRTLINKLDQLGIPRPLKR